MKYNPDIHHRRSIRLSNYDYSKSGAYFITICTNAREFVFGEIQSDKMVLNDIGEMVRDVWGEMPQHYSQIILDGSIIMPNHIHGIIFLNVGATPRGCPQTTKGQAQGPTLTYSLSDIVHRFKSLTTARYRHNVIEKTWEPFRGRLWQRNYFERIIRNDDELNRIREYISLNPAKWETDIENPNCISPDEEDIW